MGITHATSATGTDSGDGKISKNAWNADHTVTFSGALAYHNTTQSVGSSATALSLNSEDFDTDSYHDNSTNNSRMTAPATGYYLVTGHAQFASSGVHLLGLWINGSAVRGSAVSISGTSVKLQTSQIVYLTSGQYVELWGYNESTQNIGDGTYAENQTSLTIVRLA